jgi:hypothetical protein
MPPTALVSPRTKETGASLNVNVTVPVPLATFTSVLSIDTETVGSCTPAPLFQLCAISSGDSARFQIATLSINPLKS